jgi:hypothetical protein
MQLAVPYKNRIAHYSILVLNCIAFIIQAQCSTRVLTGIIRYDHCYRYYSSTPNSSISVPGIGSLSDCYYYLLPIA